MSPRSLVLILVALAILGSPAAAQEEAPSVQDSFSGLTGAVWMADLSIVNGALASADYPEVPEAVALYGQQTMLGLTDSLNLGFYLLAGEASASTEDGRTSQLASTLGGALIEWELAATDDGSKALGLALGAGSSTLTLVDHVPPDFESALEAPFRARFDRWIYTALPFVSTRGTPFSWLDLRIRVGYLFTIGCRWQAEGETLGGKATLSGGPMVEAAFHVSAATLLDEWLGEADGMALEPES